MRCQQGYGEIGSFIHFWWECEMVQLLWKTVRQFLKKVKVGGAGWSVSGVGPEARATGSERRPRRGSRAQPGCPSRHHGHQIFRSSQTFLCSSTRNSETWKENQVWREGTMDCYNPLHLLSMLSDTTIWNHVIRFCRSFLLDESYSCIPQRNVNGIGYLPNCNIWFDYAVVSWSQNHWSWRYTQR